MNEFHFDTNDKNSISQRVRRKSRIGAKRRRSIFLWSVCGLGAWLCTGMILHGHQWLLDASYLLFMGAKSGLVLGFLIAGYTIIGESRIYGLIGFSILDIIHSAAGISTGRTADQRFNFFLMTMLTISAFFLVLVALSVTVEDAKNDARLSLFHLGLTIGLAATEFYVFKNLVRTSE